VIEADGLTKSYAGRVVLDSVSLTIDEGEVVAVLGPNGAGKTTLIEILEGFRMPDRGTARVFGVDPRRDRARIASRIGVMLQEGGVYPGIRVGEAALLFASYYDDPLEPDAALRLVGLDGLARQTYRRLSGGEKQRLSLALALIGRPRLAFLDEPTGGMDPRARADAWATIRRLRDDGVTVVLATQQMDEAEDLADRVAVISRGRLRAIGAPRDLAAAGSPRVTFSAPSGFDVAALAAHVGRPVRETSAGAYAVEGGGSAALVASLTSWLAAQGVTVERLSTTGPPLEQAYLDLTADEK